MKNVGLFYQDEMFDAIFGITIVTANGTWKLDAENFDPDVNTGILMSNYPAWVGIGIVVEINGEGGPIMGFNVFTLDEDNQPEEQLVKFSKEYPYSPTGNVAEDVTDWFVKALWFINDLNLDEVRGEFE